MHKNLFTCNGNFFYRRGG